MPTTYISPVQSYFSGLAARGRQKPWNTTPLGGGGGGSFRIPDVKYPGFNYTSGTAQGTQGLTDLTEYVNQLNRAAQQLSNESRIPGAGGLEAQSSQNIAAGLRGEVDPDVLRLLQRQGAERGVGVGSESPNATTAYLQALGLTSYGLKQQAQEDLTRAYARNPAAPIFDVSSQLLTPYQVANLDLQRQQLQLQAALEAQRLALQRAALARSGGGGGGGGGTRFPTYSPGGGAVAAPTLPTYTGATGSVLSGSVAEPFTQSDWWASIGYGPGMATSTGPGTFYAGPADLYTG